MKTLYIADDGKVFESKYECERYEQFSKIQSKKMAVLADCSGDIIPFEDCYKQDLDEHSRFDEVYYIYAATPEQYENLYEAMFVDYGWGMPEPEKIKSYPAAIYYDDDADDWRDFIIVYNDVMHVSKIFNSLKEVLL